MKTIKIKTKLKNNKVKLDDADELIGKNVEITITYLGKKKNRKRKWEYSGSVDLKGRVDKLNLRDFAYE